jgi:hypothetical protein
MSDHDLAVRGEFNSSSNATFVESESRWMQVSLQDSDIIFEFYSRQEFTFLALD